MIFTATPSCRASKSLWNNWRKGLSCQGLSKAQASFLRTPAQPHLLCEPECPSPISYGYSFANFPARQQDVVKQLRQLLPDQMINLSAYLFKVTYGVSLWKHGCHQHWHFSLKNTAEKIHWHLNVLHIAQMRRALKAAAAAYMWKKWLVKECCKKVKICLTAVVGVMAVVWCTHSSSTQPKGKVHDFFKSMCVEGCFSLTTVRWFDHQNRRPARARSYLWDGK